MTSGFAPVPPTVHPPESSFAWLDRILADFEPSGLEELERVALLNRTDTKFLLAESSVHYLLRPLSAHYRVLDIESLRRHRYRTVYFDTPDWHLYEQHRTGEPVRHKVRSRVYLASGIAFLEIKSKDSGGRTSKHRMPTSKLMTRLSTEGGSFVSNYLDLDADALEMVLGNEFTRVTLVDREYSERLTLDFGLRFDHNGLGFALPGVVIAEVKQSGLNPASPFWRLMAAEKQAPSNVSKYCVGIARLNPRLNRDAFEPAFTALQSVAATTE